ncbi:hypothetical protein [Anaerococcus degeneri]|uniref:Lipoprotein n=1 Tax=Anaerococcus degeneri TaxID=361500 RepID=A0ABS7YW52_9FIRM|nr:hypothetical protein [Anaerococcus degeneri]MBP2015542.1 DNA mismatch repair ATPase MutL [Anaerococcus degeneri]MCA2095898.1 hypothetical protein [Anaerococcus degeneri]
MKKTIILTLLALSLVACDEKDLDDPRVKDALNQKEVSENIEEEPEEETQTDENRAQNEEDQDINRTYPDDKIKKEVIPVESSNKKEDSKEEKSDEKQPKKDKKSKKKDQKKADKEDKKALTADDYFFSYYSLVTVKDGEVKNVLTDLEDYGEDYFMDYVPFSNNIFVAGSVIDQKFSINKINGQDLTLMYDFKEGETFYPLAMIDDKIYGRYQYYENYDMKKNSNFIPEKSGIGLVDLKTGKLEVFKATHTKGNESLLGQGISDKEILFTKMEDDQKSNLYKLDLEKGYDQKAELVEENTKANFFLSSKHFEDGKAIYEIFKSNDDEIEIKDKKYTINDEKRMTLIGQNLIIQEPVKFDNADYLFKMDIINYLTGEVVEKDLESYGFRVYKGKLYYIDYDKKVQSLDIGL